MKSSGFRLKSLKGEKRFSEMYAKGKRFSTAKMAMIVEFADTEDSQEIETIEYAVVIGKRTAKSAVIRNRVKRLMRESIRQNFSACFGEFDKMPIKAFIVNWRQAPKHYKLIRLSDVMSEMLLAFEKVKKRIKN